MEALSESNRAFQYSSLEAREIRLIRLRSQERDTPKLLVEFETVSLDALPHAYHAISYCWGDPIPVDKVWLSNGQFLNLTASASDILRELTRLKPSDYFWIDALCINQKDNREKSKQILLMREIYGSAEQVIAFIGGSQDDDSEVVGFIETLCGAVKQLVERQTTLTMYNISELAGYHRKSSEWGQLAKFLGKPWFGRVWIVQEVVYAKKTSIFYGGRFCEWDTAVYFFAHIVRNGLGQGLLYRNPESPKEFTQMIHITFFPFINSLRQRVGRITPEGESGTGNPITLVEALVKTRAMLATDDRDKVLAVIGLAANLDLAKFDASYEESPEQLFTRTTLHVLSTPQGLDIFSLSGIGNPLKLTGLPSWVADYSTVDPRHGVYLGPIARFRGYRATGDSLVSLKTSADLKLVAIRGRLVNHVATTSRKRPAFFPNNEDMPTAKRSAAENIYWFKQTIAMVRGLGKRSAQYPTGEDWIDAYWRTIIYNITQEYTPPPSHYRDSFRAFIVKMWIMLLLDQNGAFPDTDGTMEEFVRGEFVFFITANGYIVLGPPGMSNNDKVCLLLGGKVPFLLREIGKDPNGENNYALVGECYVHGLMNGEGLDMGELRSFILK
ncbi:MAG: hypothetical protein M1820_002335 [Bogoriella megaspora]|nr:MAG: hypothetical protein M1820_002335 [Bogoriella megaspora]